MGLVSLENKCSEFQNYKFYNGIIQTWIFCIIFDILSEKDFELFTIQFLKIFMPLLLQENGKNNKLQNPSSPPWPSDDYWVWV